MNPPSVHQGQGRVENISVNPGERAALAETLLGTFFTGKVRLYA